MKAITLWQPWASLIALGVKTIETRSWAAPASLIGERIAIHAAALDTDRRAHEHRAAWDAIPHGDGLPHGAVVASAVLTACVPMVEIPLAAPSECLATGGARLRLYRHVPNYPAMYDDVTDQVPFGDFAPGRYAWLLDDIAPTTERCPACWGRTPRPHRIEGGSSSCGHCNRTLTFNFMRDGGRECSCTEAVADRACPVCACKGSCGPIPAKGAQRVWNWDPAKVAA